MIPETEHNSSIKAPDQCDRMILCTGQVYAALIKGRENNKVDNVAITRIEQLNPFPWAQVKQNLDNYPNLKEIIWAQEEPLNAGAWSFVQPRMETLLKETEHHKDKTVRYAGRNPSASVATGLKATHIVSNQLYSCYKLYKLSRLTYKIAGGS